MHSAGCGAFAQLFMRYARLRLFQQFIIFLPSAEELIVWLCAHLQKRPWAQQRVHLSIFMQRIILTIIFLVTGTSIKIKSL
jgi:hypothetical protein